MDRGILRGRRTVGCTDAEQRPREAGQTTAAEVELTGNESDSDTSVRATDDREEYFSPIRFYYVSNALESFARKLARLNAEIFQMLSTRRILCHVQLRRPQHIVSSYPETRLNQTHRETFGEEEGETKMATVPPTPPVFRQLPTTLAPRARHTARLLTVAPRAVEPDQTGTPASADTDAEQPSSTADFDDRLSQVRFKYRSGTGKKAEQRRAKAKKTRSAPASVMLPPVPLKKATSGGAKVELGFTPYSERLNGAVAGLGLAALLMVELGSGKGLFKYHAGPTILIQIYTVAALAAVFVKFEKERISVWPEKGSLPTASSDAAKE